MAYDNVVYLPNFRQLKPGKKKQILYLSNHGESLDLLQSFHGISVESATSSQSLNVQLFSWKRWDLILIESDLNWTDPKEIVALIHSELQIPVTLINKESDTEESIFRLKDLYEVGLYDCLKSPLCPRELSEVFRALIQ
jgi:DNA-binding response OmpR family regulator